MAYTLQHIAAQLEAKLIGTGIVTPQNLLTDSRSLAFPETTLFFALRTPTGDGHRYLDELYRRGVRQFVVEQLPEQHLTHFSEADFIVTPSPLCALQRLAELHRGQFHLPIVGITGSNGKTIVKEWVYQLLTPSENITRSPRSYNSQLGVPLSVWLLSEQSRIGIFEAGVSRVGEMEALEKIIRPTLGVLTNIGQAHQENFASLEEKCLEKLRLFAHTDTLIYSADDAVIATCLPQSEFCGKRLSWSRHTDDAPIRVYIDSPSPQVTRIKLVAQAGVLSKNKLQLAFPIPFTDEASVENAIHTALVGLALGLSSDQVIDRMPHLQPVAMRLEVKQGVRNLTLIDDAYNSDLNALDIALDFLHRRAEGRNTVVILSDLQQNGISDFQLYNRVARLLHTRQIQHFIGIGTRLAAHSAAFSPEAHFFSTTQDFLQSQILNQLADSMVLIKGTREFGFERITERLQRQVHQTTLEINLGALAENVRHYRSMMAPTTKLVCMVKADAYGCGSVEVARTLQDLGVDYLAVAVADEGAELRKAGITTGIIVMNPEVGSLHTLFRYGLEPEVYSFRLLQSLIESARQEGITHYPIHLKLDTGMCRLGFHPETDLEALIQLLHQQQALRLRSVFSHFVGSDGSDFNDFTQTQFARFQAATQRLQSSFSHHILRHICNSAAIHRFPQYHLDMCRLGIGLYGVAVTEGLSLDNVATLRTTILQIRHIEAGTSIGYSRRTIMERDSRIAAIPIGYADGLDRHLGNRVGHCLVNGQPAPYVGNICMDVAMIDVTHVDCKEGDKVEIFGDRLPIETLAQQLDTIPYEVLTAVSHRVKRVYYQ